MKLAKKYLKRIKEFGEEDFLTLCVKEHARKQAGLSIIRSVESILGIEEPEPEKSGPKKRCGACQNFLAGKHKDGVGSCRVDGHLAHPTLSLCDRERRVVSKAPPKENAD